MKRNKKKRKEKRKEKAAKGEIYHSITFLFSRTHTSYQVLLPSQGFIFYLFIYLLFVTFRYQKS